MTPSVFISYRHDPPENRLRVDALCRRLREEGINCILDRWESAGTWYLWPANEIARARHVLIVCTKSYLDAIHLPPFAEGVGVRWEARIIASEMQTNPQKFITIVFDAADRIHIPNFLGGVNHYDVSQEAEYRSLYAHLTNQRPSAPPLGDLISISEAELLQGFQDKRPGRNHTHESIAPSGICRVVFGTDLRDLPHDLTSGWALSRASSLAVLTGPLQTSLLTILSAAECKLNSAFHELSARTWVNVPEDIVRGHPEDFSVAMRSCSGAPPRPDITPDQQFGFLLEVGEEGESLPHIIRWCGALFQNARSGSQINVLVHLHSPALQESGPARALAERFRHAIGAVPVEMMRAIPDPVPERPVTEPEVRGEEGKALSRWLQRLRPAAAERLASRLGVASPGGERDAPPPLLGAVAADVAAACAEDPARIRAFLHGVETCSPFDLHGILRGFAALDSLAARRAALVFAARADPLMDAWIDGADLVHETLGRPALWAAEPGWGPFVDDFALGMIRRARRGHTPAQSESILRNVVEQGLLSTAARELTQEWLDHPQDSFQDFPSFIHAVLALRSGAVYETVPSSLSATWEHLDHWRLLLAQPLTSRLLADLAEGSPISRTVFGLCTAAEWAEVAAGSDVVEFITACRGGRTLLFL